MSGRGTRAFGSGLVAALLATLAGCSRSAGPAEAAAPAFPTENVVQSTLAQLETEVAAAGAAAPAPKSSESPDELREHVRGLVSMLGDSEGSMHGVVIDEAAGLGGAAVGPLQELLASDQREDRDVAAALEMLAHLDTQEADFELLHQLETGDPAWIRSQAAWRLASTSHDEVLPRVMLRLKYETDYETVIWIAAALAHFHVYEGLGVIGTVERSGPTDALRQSAAARASEIAREAGFDDAHELWLAWKDGDPQHRLPAFERSQAFALEVWRLVAGFKEYQLRGVDDARFALSGLSTPTARILSRTLHDENLYVRVHSAQCLERMGPRAAVAGADLVAALSDPEVAPHAAAALGGIRYAPGERELVRILSGSPEPEILLAAVQALGGFRAGSAQAEQLLQKLCTDPARPEEVRQAATESLVERGSATPALVLALCDWVTGTSVDPATSEHALEVWLQDASDAGSARATQVLDAYTAAGTFNKQVLDPEKRKASREERARVVREALPDLLPRPAAGAAN